jgi:hypothetical protein
MSQAARAIPIGIFKKNLAAIGRAATSGSYLFHDRLFKSSVRPTAARLYVVFCCVNDSGADGLKSATEEPEMARFETPPSGLFE